jgi:hypothetical protein
MYWYLGNHHGRMGSLESLRGNCNDTQDRCRNHDMYYLVPYKDGGTWGPKGSMAPAGSKKKKARIGIKN